MLQAEYPIWNAPSLMPPSRIPHAEYPNGNTSQKPHPEYHTGNASVIPHPKCPTLNASGMPCLECFTLNAVNIQLQTYVIQFLGVQP